MVPSYMQLLGSLVLLVPAGWMGWGVPWHTVQVVGSSPPPVVAVAQDASEDVVTDEVAGDQIREDETRGQVVKDIEIDVVNDREAAEVDALLDRLSHNADDLSAFTARITFQKYEGFTGVKVTRRGQFIYEANAAESARRFAATFTEWIRRNRKKNIQKDYVFDGRWLAEVDHAERQFIKREVVEPGDTRDPLKLGEGPFPLPLGQTTEEVRARFSVARIDAPVEGLLKTLARDVIGLHLRPHPGSPAEQDFHEVFLYFDAATLLPVGSRVVEAPLASGEHNEKLVLLEDVTRNPVLTAAERSRLSIEPPGDGWRISITRWGEETTGTLDAE